MSGPTSEGGDGATVPGPSTRKVRVLVADDHEVVRWGIRGLLEARGCTIVGEATNGLEAVDRALELDPDVVILDITMPRLNGIEAALRLRSLAPHIEILILSMHYSERVMRDVLEAGVRGYLLKADAMEHLVRAVEALSAHRPYFTAAISQHLLDEYLARAPRTGAAPETGELTRREREIVQLLAEGRSNKEIATLLDLSVKTVETHRSNLMRKLGLHGLSDLIHYAIRNHMIVS